MNAIHMVEVSTPALIDVVARLARTIWREYYTPFLGKPQIEYMLERFQSRRSIAGQIGGGYRYFIMRTAGGQDAGYCAVAFKDNELFMSKLYVVRDSRGKGYGKYAVSFIEKIAREKRLARITLNVNKKNHASIKVYQSLGFTVVRPVFQDIGDGFVMDDFVMEKSITSAKKL